MYKIITLLKRRPDLSVTDFHSYFRNIHGPIGCSHPDIKRYVQSYTLLQGYSKGELLYDAISELWFESADAYESYKQHPQTVCIMEDGANFLDVTKVVTMPVEVHVMKDGAVSGGAKSIEFVNRRTDMPLDEFRRYWREHHGPLACHIKEFKRYEQNHLRLEAYNSKREPAFDGLAVTWFESTDDMKKTVGTPAYNETRDDEANFLRAGHLPFIITTETVLKDQ